MESRFPAVIITAFVTFLATTFFWIALFAVAYLVFVANPPPFSVQVEAPREVAAGDEVDLLLDIGNPTDRDLRLDSIDIYDSLLDGFDVRAVEPDPVRRDHTFNFSSFYFSKDLEPGQSLRVTMQLTAKEPGIWTGDLDFCTPAQKFVTSSLTIRVR